MLAPAQQGTRVCAVLKPGDQGITWAASRPHQRWTEFRKTWPTRRVLNPLHEEMLRELVPGCESVYFGPFPDGSSDGRTPSVGGGQQEGDRPPRDLGEDMALGDSPGTFLQSQWGAGVPRQQAAGEGWGLGPNHSGDRGRVAWPPAARAPSLCPFVPEALNSTPEGPQKSPLLPERGPPPPERDTPPLRSSG